MLEQGVDVRLVLVNSIGDAEMAGPVSKAEREAAYHVALFAMGFGKKYALSVHVIEVFPELSKTSASG